MRDACIDGTGKVRAERLRRFEKIRRTVVPGRHLGHDRFEVFRPPVRQAEHIHVHAGHVGAGGILVIRQIRHGADVLCLDGGCFGCIAGIGSIAEENPDVKFILVDTNPTDADGNEAAYDNVYAMTFKEHESGFAAGLAAALETKSGKVAVVNGIAYPSNVNYQYGFMSGVNYANKHYGTTAECVELASYAGTDVTGANVGGNYIGDFKAAT